MKVIFLDIDGVLNSYRNALAYEAFPFPNEDDKINGADNKYKESNLDPIAIGMVRRLCEKTGAKIVLHSTWRNHVNPEAFGRKYNLPIIAGTSGTMDKPESIRDWLDTTNRNVTVVQKYVIIDDDNMKDPENQVVTDMSNGFLSADYEKALQLLED